MTLENVYKIRKVNVEFHLRLRLASVRLGALGVFAIDCSSGFT